MEIKEIKVYKFSELSEEDKQEALINLSDINTNYDWWDCIYDDALNIGLKITSFDLDRNRHCEGEFNLSPSEVCANIFRDHREDCETYKTARRFMDNWEPIFADYLNEESENYESIELEDKMLSLENDFLSSLLEDYAISLQKEYEYLCSEEAIIESIEANDYDFLESGKLF